MSIATRYHQWWERTPLRVRLVAAVLLLVTGALVLVSFANVTALQSYMTTQVDENLNKQFSREGLDEVVASKMNAVPPDSKTTNYVFYFSFRSIEEFMGRQDLNAPKLDYDDVVKLGEGSHTVTAQDDKKRWRLLVREATIETTNEKGYVVVGTPLVDVDNTVARLLWIDLLVGAGVLAALAAVGVALVRASLYPLKEMEHTATAIAGGDLSQRVPERDPRTEAGRLGRVFNQMLSRIETALEAREKSEKRALESEERMRRFVADASHELRTPLTTVRGFAELYRQRADVDPVEVAGLMRRIEDEATRMGLLVEDLLLLARLDAERPFRDAQVDLLTISVDTVTAAEVTAHGRHIELSTQGGPFLVRGDELSLRQVLSNLVSNALRYTPPESQIEVRLRSDDTHVELEVVDDGPGMTEEQVERVFERFYRADKARSRNAGGTGLGLAIVAALVDAHNGEVSVWSKPGEGAKFTVRLALDPDVSAEHEIPDADSSETV
ncbi:sensor histidine kinase [Stackebrandtia nassauensis]|uniref:histidine kinase n=1 Tax=Stackebrandtia nassauensis (strain DSM 44728 / CIP 108903 / NRRL B-16338 / NBRC 102104 / LLR-40K-21) TaxID=446470 RepID=D3QAY2_STANL|nr:HAMP domain-containing sensor histidine kinase [Stackebrandtia nassauensis]ADD44778.1 histidine kinase [Stackebrandtia nassauensis DSM 44728]